MNVPILRRDLRWTVQPIRSYNASLRSNSTMLSKVLRAHVDISSLSSNNGPEFLAACAGLDRCSVFTCCVRSGQSILMKEVSSRPKQQHRKLYHHCSRASAQVFLHTILLGVGGVIYAPHTLEPIKKLGLDTYEVIKLALKLHANSVQCAYKLASTKRTCAIIPFKAMFNHDQQLSSPIWFCTPKQCTTPEQLHEPG
eukprot:785564-Pelagomonas_calceolata.AAC.1